MPLPNDADYQLSMRISPRNHYGDRGKVLRTLLLHRLRAAPKAVLRISLSHKDLAEVDPDDYSVYCEPCDEWFQGPDWGMDFTCPGCGQEYVAETVVYSAVD